MRGAAVQVMRLSGACPAAPPAAGRAAIIALKTHALD
jgi:hypothetical protein